MTRKSLEELKEQLQRRYHEACRPLAMKISKLLLGEGPYKAEIVYAYDVYKYLAFGRSRGYVLDYLAKDVMENMKKREIRERVKAFSRLQAESARRVIETCDMSQKLIDFIPIEEELELARKRAEKRKEEDILRLLEELREMSIEGFLRRGRGIIKRLEKRGYDKLVDRIRETMDSDNRFRNTIIEEMRKLARKLLGATEREADRLIECLVEC